MSRTKCKRCGANHGIQTNKDASEYCHACDRIVKNKSLFDEKVSTTSASPNGVSQYCTTELPKEAEIFLAKYYIFKPYPKFLYWDNISGRIIFDFNKYGKWKRALDRQPKWMLDSNYGIEQLFLFSDNTKQDLCIVEDCISGFRTYNNMDTLILGGTRLKESAKEYARQYKNVYLWLDGDTAGLKASKVIRKELKLFCNVICICTPKDPKEYTPGEIDSILDRNKILA